jgi:hypothetical protein
MFGDMASMPAVPLFEPATSSTREGDEQRSPGQSKTKSRAQRFAEAHASVLEQHADAFRKLAT